MTEKNKPIPTPSNPASPQVEPYVGQLPSKNSLREGWRVVILGGGPGGYEAALVAAQLGAKVTLIEENGAGGSAVLTDVVPSKTLIASADIMTTVAESGDLGISIGGHTSDEKAVVDFKQLNSRVRELAIAQSKDIHHGLENAGIRVIMGRGVLTGPNSARISHNDGTEEDIEADIILLAVGASPRKLSTAMPDGERILTWKQMYELTEKPEHLIVVGSGVTGAEFACAYDALGVDVTLVSSRDQVLPGYDDDAATVLEDVFVRRGMQLLENTRAQRVERDGDEVKVTLSSGRVIHGSHCLMAVGAIPNTADLGLDKAGVEVNERGHIVVDRVSRTTSRSIYAAGDCTAVFPLASVAAMQGRIAMWHALGDAVKPLELHTVSSNVFTSPEVATVGIGDAEVESGQVAARVIKLPLGTNARAKMQGFGDGFIKLFCRPVHGTVVGGVIVAPRASELIHPITLAVQHRLTVDELAAAFTVYPSMSGSIAEAARQLHKRPTEDISGE